MSLVVTGKVSRINEREVRTAEGGWTEHTLVVEDWGTTEYVTASRELNSQLPAVGDVVAIVVVVRTYSGKDGGPRFALTGLRLHPDLTPALQGSGLRAVAAS